MAVSVDEAEVGSVKQVSVHMLLLYRACNDAACFNYVVVVISQTDVAVSPLRTAALSISYHKSVLNQQRVKPVTREPKLPE